MKLIAFLLLIPAIACYTMIQMYGFGKLRWSKPGNGFWGYASDIRKYKFPHELAPDTWYYRFYNLRYREKFPLSATLLVFLTDGYHLMQFFMFIFLSLSITFAIGFDWYLLAGVWTGIHFVHAGFYKLLQR